MANSVIASAPLVIGIDDRDERDDLSNYGYRLSRSLLGDELADQLMFPESRIAGAGTLAYLRLRRRIQEVIDVFRWGKRPRQRARNFITLLHISMLKPDMITYRLPNRLHADAARWW